MRSYTEKQAHALDLARTTPRCGAKTRRGKPCQAPCVAKPEGGYKSRCRMHGGAAGSGAPKGNQNALKHGFYTAKAKQQRLLIRRFFKELQTSTTVSDEVLFSLVDALSPGDLTT
ncbi:HGGxSTG domain-containing protein [Trichloromonas sp.]|uniref:HGGxSTG domain-containing protein n=1 Tax=Trichloromonas sp. TaxID=3069249 RepID=UPI001D80D87F|nr:hypothetical protein [Desulfuromonadaceae bacterium]MDY0269071.1 HGGxSTG domain-containing protein [Trichloromonas sp.]